MWQAGDTPGRLLKQEGRCKASLMSTVYIRTFYTYINQFCVLLVSGGSKLQLSEHFIYLNTLQSKWVQISDFLLHCTDYYGSLSPGFNLPHVTIMLVCCWIFTNECYALCYGNTHKKLNGSKPRGCMQDVTHCPELVLSICIQSCDGAIPAHIGQGRLRQYVAADHNGTCTIWHL